MKNVLISKKLFDNLVYFHIVVGNEKLIPDQVIREIKSELEEKIITIKLRDLYGCSKSCEDPELREIARQLYLDGKNITKSFRW